MNFIKFLVSCSRSSYIQYFFTSSAVVSVFTFVYNVHILYGRESIVDFLFSDTSVLMDLFILRRVQSLQYVIPSFLRSASILHWYILSWYASIPLLKYLWYYRFPNRYVSLQKSKIHTYRSFLFKCDFTIRISGAFLCFIDLLDKFHFELFSKTDSISFSSRSP